MFARPPTFAAARGRLVWARIHPAFLVDAVRYYVDRSDRREQIGTSAEHERLVSDLGVPTSVRG
jgi:hypothetical protein